MKQAIQIIGVLLIIICIGFIPNPDNQIKNSVEYIEYFKKGQALLSDMVCPDTLIVVDEVGLNTDMGLIEQGIKDATDYELKTIFYTHCKIK